MPTIYKRNLILILIITLLIIFFLILRLFYPIKYIMPLWLHIIISVFFIGYICFYYLYGKKEGKKSELENISNEFEEGRLIKINFYVMLIVVLIFAMVITYISYSINISPLKNLVIAIIIIFRLVYIIHK